MEEGRGKILDSLSCLRGCRRAETERDVVGAVHQERRVRMVGKESSLTGDYRPKEGFFSQLGELAMLRSPLRRLFKAERKSLMGKEKKKKKKTKKKKKGDVLRGSLEKRGSDLRRGGEDPFGKGSFFYMKRSSKVFRT